MPKFDSKSLKQKLNLKIGLLNAENLFLLFDQPLPTNYLKLEENQWQKLSQSVYDNKPLFKTKQIAATIKTMNVDILQLTEVGGLESLKNLNKYFLDDQYSPILIEGNSDRSIDVGFLIRKTSDFYFDLMTHKNRPLNFLYPHEKLSKKTNYPPQITSHKMSRDCAELRLFKKEVQKPFLILLLTHLKSPLDPERIDPSGTERRTAELKACVSIYNELQAEFPSCPILLSGDFNGNASKNNTEPEFAELYAKTDLIDVLESAQVPTEQRITFIQIKSGQRSEGRQIDYCFIPKKLEPHLNKSTARVFEYQDEYGSNLKRPETLEQKMALPSDHYPLLFNLENLSI